MTTRMTTRVTTMMFRRGICTAKAIVYSEYGAPLEKLRVFEHELQDPQDSQVLVRTLAFPINPADINQVEGVYPSRPEMNQALGSSIPVAVGGNEGVFEVLKTGPHVSKSIQPGDWVLPSIVNIGTWRSHALLDSSRIYKIQNRQGISPVQASIISVNPTTAHQMLKRFVDLKPGDWFIQNGATSGVGRAAIQLGKIWGLNSINVVRDRPNIEELRTELEGLGATQVITEEQLSDKTFIKTKVKEWTGGKPIKLGLNCVSGKSATNVSRQLGHGGQLITYGGMSKQPLTFPTSLFIFKDIVARGYWLSEWTKKDPAAKMEVVEELLQLVQQGKLKDAPVSQHKFKSDGSAEDFEQVFKAALSTKGKSVLVAE